MPKIVCVVPTVRPASHESFVKAWAPLFKKHSVELITVWDGDDPGITVKRFPSDNSIHDVPQVMDREPYHLNRDLFCRRTDACRNLGFVWGAALNPDYVLTLDDDVAPCTGKDVCGHDFAQGEWFDPIQAHIDALNRRVPLGWMNTAHDTDLYLRGVPYGVRDEAPVMLSHGVWVGTPDFDGETQSALEDGTLTQVGAGQWARLVEPDRYMMSDGQPKPKHPLPYSLPYYVGPVPRGVLFPLCGMNVMVRREALPYLYYAPQGADSGVLCPMCTGSDPEFTRQNPCPMCRGSGAQLHRMADIFMGCYLKRKFDELGWACVTGYSTVLHTRASDARKNFESEKLGREWMEMLDVWDGVPEFDGYDYFRSYADKRTRYAALIESILGGGK